MPSIPALVAALTALGLSAWLTQRFCDPASRLHILDHPNERSLHTRPTPRSGGIAILFGLLAGGTLTLVVEGGAEIYFWLLVAVLPVAAVSFADDRASVPVTLRMLVHLVGAGLLVGGGGFALQQGLIPGVDETWPQWVGTLAALLYVVWMTNLYNFMDGMDGFAGGMGVFGFGAFFILGVLAGHEQFAALSLVSAASAGGFLLFNFPPARIFMGDVGSSALGLLAAALTLYGARDGVFPFWVGFLVFSPFIVDATVTLLRRLSRGENIWQAHKSHYYQRLVLSGWGHRKTVLYEYALMLACGLSALFAQQMSALGQGALIIFWSLVYAILMAGVRHLEKKKNP